MNLLQWQQVASQNYNTPNAANPSAPSPNTAPVCCGAAPAVDCTAIDALPVGVTEPDARGVVLEEPIEDAALPDGVTVTDVETMVLEEPTELTTTVGLAVACALLKPQLVMTS